MYSVAAPYFFRLFEVIEKENIDRVTFEELTIGLIMFCLFTREEMFSFLFCMFDEDGDNLISKLDIFRFLLQFRMGYKVFNPNYTRAVEITKIKRGDKMNIVEFVEILNEVPFLCFPAFRLQSIMRERFGGLNLWKRAEKLRAAKTLITKTIEERQKFKERKELI